jgi:hypothetical protein
MDYSLMAFALINTIDHKVRSALPHAPVVAERCAGGTRGRLSDLRGRLASVLHRAAWAIEPAPAVVPRPDGEAATALAAGSRVLMDEVREKS